MTSDRQRLLNVRSTSDRRRLGALRWTSGRLIALPAESDRQNGDVYVSDGESRNGNRRVAVMDANGNFLRQWKPEGMEAVHCMTIADDGTVYVCNRENARIQLYDKMGNFKKSVELPWKPYTAPADGKVKQSGGATVALDFSHDAGQSLMFIVNQNNSQIDVVDRRSAKLLSSFGQIGKLAGQFDQAHGIATDSKNNVYVAENRGRRIHKFKSVGQQADANVPARLCERACEESDEDTSLTQPLPIECPCNFAKSGFPRARE